MGGDDAIIIQQVQTGNPDAFRVLVERHSRGLFRLAYRLTGNEHDAEDVVQETFLRAYRNLNRFESRAAFGTWLHRIGANCALDLLRGRKQEAIVNEHPTQDREEPAIETVPSDEPAPDAQVIAGQIREKVVAAMASLSTTERSAFVLRHFEEMSIKEIGATLGLKDNATKNTIFRAVQKIRRTLTPVMGDLR
jgi:RNA polymerase sigma-70 factor (ECF subfamily)